MATMDFIRLVFDRLHAAGTPDAEARAAIYDACRADVAAAHTDAAARDKALEALEKVIRRQEMQAVYEETLGRGTSQGSSASADDD